jgi:hypothetical protein
MVMAMTDILKRAKSFQTEKMATISQLLFV